MEIVSTTVEAITILIKVLEFYRNVSYVPDHIKASFERSKESSELLKTWVLVFQRLESADQNPTLETLCAPLMATLDRLDDALDAHRVQVKKWMKKVGIRETPPDEEQDTKSPMFKLTKLQKKRSSFSPLEAAQKVLFVTMGSDALDSLEKTVKNAQGEVMALFLTIVTATSLESFLLNSDTATGPPIANFVLAAQKRKQSEAHVNIITEDEIETSYTTTSTIIDRNVPNARQIHLNTIVPKWESHKLEPGRYICYSRSGELDKVESMNLARLFAADEEGSKSVPGITVRDGGDMLRCVAVVEPASNLYLQYIFKVPHNSAENGIRTLRSLLLDERACPNGQTIPYHPIADRVKFSIRLATSVLVVHSLGLVHKRIHPESILVIEEAGSKRFPANLGYPYLVGFHLSRSENARTTLQQDTQELLRRGIYFHPREQATIRTKRYSMISDIYSLGVCLLEIALWKSLFVSAKGEKDYVQDKAARFENLADGAYPTMDREDRAYAKKDELIRIAGTEIPRVMGDTFAKVVVSCLQAGSEIGPFADTSTSETKPVSVEYLNSVLKKLRVVHDGVSEGH